MSSVGIDGLALELTQRAGLAAPSRIQPLPGGRNNRVYRLALVDGTMAVLKSYHHDRRDPRDRLKAEWDFLAHIWSDGIRNVPQPLAVSADDHAALYGFIEGQRPVAATSELVMQAADFIIAINRSVPLAQFGAASEACFSFADHLEIVTRRVAQLAEIDGTLPDAEKAKLFVTHRLVPAWQRIKDRIETQATARGAAMTTSIARPILSPSDFGFHNALVDPEGRAYFLDFEYAGRDDPAKLICDFFCQPDIPAPQDYHRIFISHLADGLNFDADDLWRVDVLLDAYRIKWICIMLNEFSEIGARRRDFAAAPGRESRAAAQLARAERSLARLES